MLPRISKFKKGNAPTAALLPVLFGLLLMAVLFIFLAGSNLRLYGKRASLERQLDALRGETAELEKRSLELQSDIVRTQTEEYTEEVARERLNLKKPGEEVVAVVVPESGQEGTSSEEQQSWLEKILEKIGL